MNKLLSQYVPKILSIKSNSILKALPGLLICCLLFSACSKVEVQREAPQAIKDVIKDTELSAPGCNCHPLINQYIWRNENVYVLAYNDSLSIAEGYICDWLPTFYNSNGQVFTLHENYTYETFLKEGRLIRNVWTCE